MKSSLFGKYFKSLMIPTLAATVGLPVALLWALSSTASHARNLNGRFGLGATHVGPGLSAPVMSLNYHQGQASAYGGLFGIDTQTGSNSLVIGGQFQRNLFVEENLNFYVGMTGGLLTLTAAGATVSSSGYMLEAALGSEAFIPGIPNLGFHLASGFRLESPSAVRIRTVFYTGMHYYF